MYTPGWSDLMLLCCVGLIALVCKTFDWVTRERPKPEPPVPPEGFSLAVGDKAWLVSSYDNHATPTFILGHHNRDHYVVKDKWGATVRAHADLISRRV